MARGEASWAELILRSAAPLEGTISWKGSPHSGVEVLLLYSSLPELDSRTFSDHAGRFSFERLETREDAVLAFGGTVIRNVAAKAGESVHVEAPLRPVHLEVRGFSLTPDSFVELYPELLWGNIVQTETWPAVAEVVNSQAAFSRVPPGRYVAALRDRGSLLTTMDFTLELSAVDEYPMLVLE